MALKVWLPLNGNLENKGISDVTVTNNGATVDNNGKIGKCYSLTTGNHIDIGANNINNYKYSPISVACWVYFSQTDSTQRYIINCLESGGCGLCWQNQQIEWMTYIGEYKRCWSDVLTLNEWHHVCGTYDGEISSIYIDGILQNTLTANGSITYHATCPWEIGGNPSPTAFNSGNLAGSINDVRIYDHCLSQKEIKEISQGLILHYKLDMPTNNLLLNGNILKDRAYWVDWRSTSTGDAQPTRSVATINGKKWLTVKTDGVTGVWVGFNQISYENGFDINFKPNTDYTISATMYATSAVNGRLWFHTRSSEGGANLSQPLQTISLTTTPTRYSYTFNSGTNDSYNINRFNFMIGIANNTANVEGYFTDIKLEEGSVASDWTPCCQEMGIDTTKVIDSSGYGNDGTIMGDISFLIDPSRYSISAYMNNSGTANHIEYNALTTSGAYTIAFWVKANLSKNQVIFADKDHGYEFGILNNLFYTSTTTNKGWSTSKFITNNWNHIAIISQDGIEESNVKLFVNGVEETSRAGANNWYAHNKTNPWLLNRGNNNTYAADASLSDFRIYATALSAEDVATLYHTSAQIDDLGSFHAFEFCEKETENLSDFEVSTIWSADGVTRTIEETDFGTAFKLIASSGNKRIYKTVVDLWEENQEYIVSFYAKSTTDGVVCNMSRSLVDFSRDFTLTTQWNKYTGKIKSTATASGGTLSFAIKSTPATVYITNIKLELANQNLIKVHQNGLWDSNNLDEISFTENAQLNKNNNNIIGNNFIEK